VASLAIQDSPTPSNWYGITVNYQIDSNKYKTPYSVYLDKVTFSAKYLGSLLPPPGTL